MNVDVSERVDHGSRAAQASAERRSGVESAIWAVVRISIGFVFLWAFIDKLLH